MSKLSDSNLSADTPIYMQYSYEEAARRFEAACTVTQPLRLDDATMAAWVWVHADADRQKRIQEIVLLDGTERTTKIFWERMMVLPWTIPAEPLSSQGDAGIVGQWLFRQAPQVTPSTRAPHIYGWDFPARTAASRMWRSLGALNERLAKDLILAHQIAPTRMEYQYRGPTGNPGWIGTSSSAAVVTDSRTYRDQLPLLACLEFGIWFVMMIEPTLFLVPLPTVCKVDDGPQMHSTTGPAFEWNGAKLYYHHGVECSERIIMQPETITVEEINAERNAELRRVMIEQMGYERYIKKSGAQLVGEDSFGKLWRSSVTGEREDIVVVEVVNSTPEPDGHYKHYWLRVDPRAYNSQASTVPQAAIASTWRKRDGSLLFAKYTDYTPIFES